MNPYNTLAACIRRRNFEQLRPLLHPDCVLRSTWKLTDLCGADKIMWYFTGKAQTQREAGAFPRGRVGVLLSYEPGTPCVAIYQDSPTPDIIVLLEIQDHLVTKISFFAPELFDYSFDLELMKKYWEKKTVRVDS